MIGILRGVALFFLLDLYQYTSSRTNHVMEEEIPIHPLLLPSRRWLLAEIKRHNPKEESPTIWYPPACWIHAFAKLDQRWMATRTAV